MPRIARSLALAFVVAFVGLVVAWFTASPLDGYSRTRSMTVPDCTIDVIVGHYTQLPHRFVTGPCAGATLKGCLMGGGTYHRTVRPDVQIPAKELTPFPGAAPLSTDEQYPDDGFASGILADVAAARAHARTLLARCDCPSIKVRVVFAGFDEGYVDRAIKGALRDRGVEPREEVVAR